RVIEVTQPTYHRWRQQYGGMQAEEARRLTQLEKENARLKKLSGTTSPCSRQALRHL
ncbi:MAG: transposase, partial [Cyanobacteria bacterium K_DeepCast_35m_m1_288]|nr:transposase [Cyanobacteria bacterium K_DeepCast_35m_m1_288]